MAIKIERKKPSVLPVTKVVHKDEYGSTMTAEIGGLGDKIYLEGSDDQEFTPSEARQLGQALIEMADQIENKK